MCEKAALKEQSDNRDVQQQLQRVSDQRPLESNRRVPMLGMLERGSWTRTPLSPKTPALNEEAPLQTRMDLFSSLIKEQRTSLEQNMRQKSKRNLEDDFLTALDGEHTVKKEPKAAEAAPVPYWELGWQRRECGLHAGLPSLDSPFCWVRAMHVRRSVLYLCLLLANKCFDFFRSFIV